MSKLSLIQKYLKREPADGWLLYGFRDQNPIALSVAGLTSAGSRRWFLWIPASGRPEWIVHAIERTTFLDLPPDLDGKLHLYVSWQDLSVVLDRVINTGRPGTAPTRGPNRERRSRRVLMEYSPENAVPYVSRVDAGMVELVRNTTGAEILSSADAVQTVVATIDADHLAGHRRAAEICLGVKDEAFGHIAEKLVANVPINEYDVQQFIAERFADHDMDPVSCIVSVNGNAADPHYFPRENNHSFIRRGDVVLIDLWNRERGDPDACFADITWTAYCGVETPTLVARIFDIVRAGRDRAVELMQESLAAGRPIHGYEVDDACRGVIAAEGYGEAFIHRTGHSLGSTGHYIGVNIDNLETRDRRSLIPGVMFSIEPGIYLPDVDFDGSGESKGLGIRTEIDCYVHENGVEVTTLPLQTEVTPLLRD